MPKILLLTSSPSDQQSLSTRFASELAHALTKGHENQITWRNLTSNPLPHIDSAYVQGRNIADVSRSPEQAKAVDIAQNLIDELKAADIVVIGSAMINFSISTQLKTWFDYVLWPGHTVQFSDSGAKGLITDKKVYLVTAAGGRYVDGPMAAFDYQSKYLEHLLQFMGLSDIEHIRIEGVAYGPEATQVALDQANAQIQRYVKETSKHYA